MRLAASLVLALAALGCASSPDPLFFALSARPGAAVESRPVNIELRRIGIPSYLDRASIVRRATPERLELAADERWGAPLQEMVETTLAEDLGQRLPHSVVYREAGAITSSPDVRVEVELSHFELTDRGTVELVAAVAVAWNPPAGPVRVERHALHTEPASRKVADLVASMSTVLGQLSDAIALTIRRGPDPAPQAGAAVAEPDARP